MPQRRKSELETHISRQKLKLRDLRNAVDADSNLGQDPNVDELEEEITVCNGWSQASSYLINTDLYGVTSCGWLEAQVRNTVERGFIGEIKHQAWKNSREDCLHQGWNRWITW